MMRLSIQLILLTINFSMPMAFASVEVGFIAGLTGTAPNTARELRRGAELALIRMMDAAEVSWVIFERPILKFRLLSGARAVEI